MNVEDALKSSEIDRLDAEVLLAHAIGKSREWLMAHPEEEIDDSAYQKMVERRKNDEPVAYIVQNQEFYGKDFYVDSRVLIPRSSTERLIDLALDFLEDSEDRIRELDTKVIGVARKFGDLSEVEVIIDLCTGSGCIAVILALETGKKIIATDISQDALEVAKKNAHLHGVESLIEFRLGDLIEPIKDLSQPFFLITNPPYIPEYDKVEDDVGKHEPNLALYGGADGSESVVKIYNTLKAMEWCRGCVIECREIHAMLL